MMAPNNQTALDAVHQFVGKYFSEWLRQPIKLTRIDSTTLRNWSETWRLNNPREPPNGGWDWIVKKQYRDQHYPAARWFEVAVWHQNDLCGLSLGHLSRDSSHLVIHYLEGSPLVTHPLKGYVLKIILETGLEYAKLVGKRYLILKDPVTGLIDTYQKLGFNFKQKGLFHRVSYCEKEVLR